VYANGIWVRRATWASDSSFDADVGGLREWQRASVQQKGVFDEEYVRVREPEHRAKGEVRGGT
jgi:hypothetical protein